MANQQLGSIISVPASGDLSASQFCAMALNSSGQALLPAANASIFGVLQNDPSVVGHACEMQVGAVAKWKLGGTVAAGDYVKVDSSGRAVTADGTAIAAGYAMGLCIEGGAINNIGSILVLANTSVTAVTGIDALTTAAAASLLTDTTTLAVTGTIAYTLAAPLYVGQKKRVRCISAASTPLGTLTIADTYASEDTTHIFTSAGQEIALEGTATGWKLIDVIQAGTEVVAASRTINQLCLMHTFAIADTVDFVLESGLLPGVRAILLATANSGTPVGTVSGVFRVVATGAATGIDITYNAAGDQAIVEWDGAAWVVNSLTSTAIA